MAKLKSNDAPRKLKLNKGGISALPSDQKKNKPAKRLKTLKDDPKPLHIISLKPKRNKTKVNSVQIKSLKKSMKTEPGAPKINSSPNHNVIGLVPKQKILDSVAILRKIVQEYTAKSKTLFEDEQPIKMQVVCVKIAHSPTRILRITLPHALQTETSDICLFVPDLHKGRRTDHEPSIQHYEDLLRSHDITNIKGIIPLRQVKVEHDQFELKRRLLGQYDFFLTDAKISGHLAHLLGKIFTNKRKNPTPVRLDAKNLKEEIKKGLQKTPLHFTAKGDTHTVTIGHTQQKNEAITENIQAAIKFLGVHYPGGWANIRSIYIKTERSMALPIYISLKSNTTVQVPRIKPLRPKQYKDVEGELTTRPGFTVVLGPVGAVTLRADNQQTPIEQQNDSESEPEEMDTINDGDVEMVAKTDVQSEDENVSDDSDEEGGKLITAAEETYFKNYEHELEESKAVADKPKKPIGKVKKIKKQKKRAKNAV